MRTKNISLLMLVILMLGILTFTINVDAQTNISSCGILNQANSVYVLTTNVSSVSTCFTISANNITLDGQGYTINYSISGNGYGIVDIAGYNNIVIQNLNIVEKNIGVTYSHGIYFKNVANSSVKNTTIITKGNNSDGIYLNSSSSNIFSNFTISTSGTSSYGIYVYLSNLNYFSAFNIITSGYNGDGIYITSSNNNNFSDSNISTSGAIGHGIYDNGNYNIFSNVNISVLGTNNTNTNGFYLKSANNNIIKDSKIISALNNDYFLQDAGLTNSFRNTNFTTRNIYLYDNSSSFNYNRETSAGIWLNTTQIVSPSALLVINRTLLNWTQSNISWQEKLKTSRRLSYSINGLMSNTNYSIWNDTIIAYNLTTDNSGNLPAFGINFSTTSKLIKVIPQMLSFTYIPPIPTNLTSSQGNFWINYSWQAGEGNITDSYNVSASGIWTNGTTVTYSNNSVGPHGWDNISVWTYNNSGSSSQSPSSQNIQVVNNIPVQAQIGNEIVIEGDSLEFVVSITDVDSDPITYGTDATKGILNSSTGVYSWQTNNTDIGIYTWYFNSSDNYGGVASETITINVEEKPTYILSGFVSDNNGIGLDGVQIQNESYQTNSTRYGFYSINLPNGTYNFSYSKMGFETGYLEVTISGENISNTNVSIYDTIPPAQVTGLINDTPTQTTVNLSWDNITGASYYQIFRNSVVVGYTINGYWNDTGLTADTLYQYYVRTNDSYNNWGQNSSILNVTTLAKIADTIPPNSVINPNVFTGNFWINNTWSNPEDIDFDRVMFKFSNDTVLQNVSNSTDYLNITWISHYAQNISGQTVDTSGNINQTKIWFDITIPNNEPVLEPIGNMSVNEGDLVHFNITAIDIDNDTLIYGTYATKGILDTLTGNFAWLTTNSDSGIYSWDFNSSDEYGGVVNETVVIIVSKTPLKFTSFFPLSDDPRTIRNNFQNFSVITNKIANIIWYINGSIVQSNMSTNSANLTASNDEIGVSNVTVIATDDIDIISKTWNWTITPIDYIPPDPINLQNAIGNFWVNHTWQPGIGNNTDSYNVSINGVWSNGTTQLFENTTTIPHGWVNITILAYNLSDSLSDDSINQNTLIPNNDPIQDIIGNKTIDEGQLLTFKVNVTDIDNDTIVYGTNATKGNFDYNTGQLSWTPGYGDEGIYFWNFNSRDGFGKIANEIIEITVNDVPLSIINSSPDIDPVTTIGTLQNFEIELNRTSNVTWYLNGSAVQSNSSVLLANYTSIGEIGISNIAAVAIDYDTVSKKWNWTVNPKPLPNITSWTNNKTNDDNSSLVINTSEIINFNIITDQIINSWNWYRDSISQNNNYDNFPTSWSTPGNRIVEANVTNDNGTSNTILWQIEVIRTMISFVPPSPVNIMSNTNNFWINTTWIADSGNISDGYNITVNGIWINGTDSYINSSLFPRAWQNMTIYAYNSSEDGSLSSPVINNIQIPNNNPIQAFIGNKTIYEGELLTFKVNVTDIDNDTIVYGTNATKGNFDDDTGQFSWAPGYGDEGIYLWNFNSRDEFGGIANETIEITVNSLRYIPPSPTGLTEIQGNFWINYTWTVGIGNNTDRYNVSANGIWINNTINTYYNNSVGPHNWSNISVYAFNNSGILNQTPISQNTQVTNNIPKQSTIENKSVVAGNLLIFTISTIDADNDTVTYDTNATKGILNSSTGVYSWQTNNADIGIYTWYFNSSDNYGGVASETITINATSNGRGVWINLTNNSGELLVNDSPSLNNLSWVVWNIWTIQNQYTTDAGLFGKYQTLTGERSYIVRTSNVNGTSIVISGDGTNIVSYKSDISRACGIRNNDEPTMISVRFNGLLNISQIGFFRNGIKCSTSTTSIKSLYNAPVPLRIGGGNNIFLNGMVDEGLMYNSLPDHQIYRFYQESEHGLAGKQTIPVLVYHRVIDPADASDKISYNNFSQQMAFLHNNDFTTITTENFKQWQKGNFTMPERPVIIFFDDGWDSTYYSVSPIFDLYGYVGVVPIVTNYVDQESTGNWTNYVNWPQTKELQNKGWEIASHSLDHVSMLTLNDTAFRSELNLSSIDIIQNTGKKPTSFLFPSHLSNVTYTSICGEYYDLCWAYGSSDTSPKYTTYSDNGHIYQSLKRITIYNTTTIQTFKDIFAKEINTPIGSWPMNEGIGNKTYDNSGNVNDALLNTNATWYIQTIQ